MQIEEGRRRQSEQASVIDAGLTELDLNQQVEFTEYRLSVLPIDSYVYWLRQGTVKIPGALHHWTEMLQNEDETLGLATVTFTTLEQVIEFTETPINTIYIARRGDFRYAFSRQQGYFQASQVWHYQGRSVYPAMLSQLLDDPSSIDPSKAVVSNSLPIWLAFNGYQSPYVGGFSNPVTLYPSKAVPANLPPPYGAVHIPPEQTRALQGVPMVQQVDQPLYASDGSQVVDSSGNPVLVPTRVLSQLLADKVKITLYGLQSDAALQFYGSLLEYIGAQGPMGLMSMPAMADGKREQVELQALAMQKLIEFDVSYNTYYAKTVALQTIKSASITVAATF